MSTQPIDYAAILNDLEAKKVALEAAIASVRAALAVGLLGPTGEGVSVLGAGVSGSMAMFGGEVPAGAFLGKTIPDAAKFYLEIVKKKQTSKEIAEALLKGGMESASKNFPSIVHAILDRACKGKNPGLVKLGTQWGLASWYRNFVPGTAAKPGKKKLQKKAAKKNTVAKPMAVKAEQPTVIAQPVPTTEQKGMTGKRIVNVMTTKSGTEFTLRQVAEETGLGLQKVNLAMANLVRSRKAEKTSSGKYRAIIAAKTMETHAVA